MPNTAPEVFTQKTGGIQSFGSLLRVPQLLDKHLAIHYREISRKTGRATFGTRKKCQQFVDLFDSLMHAYEAMKKLTFILFLFPTILFCQEPPKAAESPAETAEAATDGTTVEEWLYATKGFEDDVSKGKDPEKEGYTFEKTHTLVTENFFAKEKKGRSTYTIDFVEMKKAGKAKVTIVKITSGSKLDTYAFPAPDCAEEVGEDYVDSVAEMGADRAKVILLAYHDYVSALRSKR